MRAKTSCPPPPSKKYISPNGKQAGIVNIEIDLKLVIVRIASNITVLL